MKILSVNTGRVERHSYLSMEVTTAIHKRPVQGRVGVTALGIEGDEQADLEVHGGVDKAVYCYAFEHYAYWAEQLNLTEMEYGYFGENLTLKGLMDEAVNVGDIYQVGSVLLEVTQPRVPCYKLSMRMAKDGFAVQFLTSGRVGFYARVLREGDVGANDDIIRLRADAALMNIPLLSGLEYKDEPDTVEQIKKTLVLPALSLAWRQSLSDRLKLLEARNARLSQGEYRSFQVVRRVDESDVITSFYLKSTDGMALDDYRPGQHIATALPIRDRHAAVVRHYTLSDRPGTDYYRLSIKRTLAPKDKPDLPAGVSSNYFHDYVPLGSTIAISAPQGDFFLDPMDDTPIVLLSGGVGITPMISMLNAIMADNPIREIWFVHGARDSSEHAFASEMMAMADAHEHFHVFYCYSRPGEDDRFDIDYHHRGHVDLEWLEAILPHQNFDFYLCGPTPFMKSLYNGLLDWGVGVARIHYEFFGPSSILKERSEGDEVAVHEVVFKRSGITVKWDGSANNLLELAENNGVFVDFSCRVGVCLTCMCRLIAGEVEYLTTIQGQPSAGHILICSARPVSDVVLDL